jgi:hypothetical protein
MWLIVACYKCHHFHGRSCRRNAISNKMLRNFKTTKQTQLNLLGIKIAIHSVELALPYQRFMCNTAVKSSKKTASYFVVDKTLFYQQHEQLEFESRDLLFRSLQRKIILLRHLMAAKSSNKCGKFKCYNRPMLSVTPDSHRFCIMELVNYS